MERRPIRGEISNEQACAMIAAFSGDGTRVLPVTYAERLGFRILFSNGLGVDFGPVVDPYSISAPPDVPTGWTLHAGAPRPIGNPVVD